MRIRILPLLCAVFVLHGCKTFTDVEEPLTWNEDERRLARSLAHFAQGLVYENSPDGKPEQALSEFIKASEWRSEAGDQKILPRIAPYYLYSGNGTEAGDEQDLRLMEFFSNAMDGGSRDAGDYYTLARLLFKRNEDARAIEVINRGLANADAKHVLKTYCYLQARDFIENKQILRAAACFELLSDETSPDYARFHFVLAELYQLLDQHDKAIENLQIATAGPNPLPEAFIKHAFYYFHTDPEKALEILTKGIEKLPSDPKVLFYKGYVYWIQNRPEEAIGIYKKVPELTALDSSAKLTPEFFLVYGSACEQAGKYDQAEEVFKDGLKEYPDNHEILNYLAYMFAENGTNLDEALEYIDKALEVEPENGAYIDTLGWIYYKQGRYEEALNQIDKALKLMPDDATIQDHMGDIYLALGRTEEAIECWKQSFILDPSSASVQSKLEERNVSIKKLLRQAKHNKKQKPDNLAEQQ